MPLSTAVATLIPAAIAVAILRYRLYDIDVWISRTVLYVLLTVFVVGTYSALVSAVGRLWDGGDTLAPAVAAAVVALTFNPVRAWGQQRVNRLMFGDRDDPYSALSRLSARLATVAEAGGRRAGDPPDGVARLAGALRRRRDGFSRRGGGQPWASGTGLGAVRALCTIGRSLGSPDRRWARSRRPVLLSGSAAAAGTSPGTAAQRSYAAQESLRAHTMAVRPPTRAGAAGHQPRGGTPAHQQGPARLSRRRPRHPGP